LRKISIKYARIAKPTVYGQVKSTFSGLAIVALGLLAILSTLASG
jgi:hypothetical protein